MRPIVKCCSLACTTLLMTGCITTTDPYDQPFNSGYTGYNIGVGPSYWGSGYAPNPGYSYGYGNASMMRYGGSEYYRSGYYGAYNGNVWYNDPIRSIRSNLRQ